MELRIAELLREARCEIISVLKANEETDACVTFRKGKIMYDIQLTPYFDTQKIWVNMWVEEDKLMNIKRLRTLNELKDFVSYL